LVDAIVVVVVELVEVDREVLVLLVLVDDVLTEVELVETDDVLVDREVLLVEVEVAAVVVDVDVLLVEVELYEVDVVLVVVLEVEVEVVTLSSGNSSPSDNLYDLPTTTALAVLRLIWLMAWM
jgi:hypothetical protein